MEIIKNDAREDGESMSEVVSVSEMFGKDVFNDAVMKDRLPKSVYKKLKKTIEDGAELDPSIADVVAHAMKDWAIEHGATHFTHWLQPLTRVTAEKHESFISAPVDGKVIMEFSGKELIKGEPDASSFPSGGLRATFEARGYTVWDCTSPAFLKEDAIGVTLCIPSVGPEQEYFIVDRAKYLQRKDLIYTGRTLFGAMPPKGQEMDDHYFGVIRERIGSYMNDLNKELWKLGVPAKTQHNEVAPAQHELAPIYEGVNQSVDHNQIVMETMKKVAERHGLACLLHEKPFAGVNGSGKHNNWSLTADDGTNLMNPGDTPHENIQFLLVLACIIKAVDIHADLLRESASNVGNDHRLGANEAPPAIISIFLGEQLEDVIDQLCDTGEATHSKQGGTLKTGVDILPDFDKDATDRNRTSPFAFTGNKFEFRMVGSSDSIASANTVLNTIIAEAFKEAADKLEKADNFDMAVHDMIKETLAAHKRVVFNGNGYSDEWVAEAERRGLPNIKSMVDAIPALITDKAVKLFEEFGVFTKTELESRVEVEYEGYAKAINIEAKTMIDMAGKQIIPAVIKYTTALAASISAVKSACPEADVSTQTELLLETSDLLAETKLALAKLTEITEKSAAMDGGKDQAVAYHEEVVPAMAALRTPVDKLEMLVDKDLWPMPSYGDLIFEV